MKNISKDYVIIDVGNYQLCGIGVAKGFIVPLNAIMKDILVKSKIKTFLILKHALLVDLDFINFIMNRNNVIDFNINCNHIIHDITTGEESILERTMKATLINMRISCELSCCNKYDLVFEIHSIDDKNNIK
jgi:hypothetical protein